MLNLKNVDLLLAGRSRTSRRWRGECTGTSGYEPAAARQEEPRGEPVRPGVPAALHQGPTGAQAQKRGSLAGREF